MTKKDIAPASTEDEVVATEIEDKSKTMPNLPAGGTPRRAPGQKEVIPFVWKVGGYSFDGHSLTLFKSVERADAEAHLARLETEGYYQELKIYPVDEKIPPSPMAKKRQAAEVRKEKTKSKRSEPATSTEEAVVPDEIDEEAESPDESATADQTASEEAAAKEAAAKSPAVKVAAAKAPAIGKAASKARRAPKAAGKASPKSAGKKKTASTSAKKKTPSAKKAKKKSPAKKKSKT